MSNAVEPTSTLPVEIERQLSACGLDVKAVLHHRENVKLHLSAKSPRFFPIEDTCRRENGGILALPTKSVVPNERKSIVAFVPAAGASSRYLQPLLPLIEALKSRNASSCQQELALLRGDGFLDCPLPASIKELISYLDSAPASIPSALADRVISELDAPKALYPAVIDGLTFLKIKHFEHEAIGRISGEVYISPPQYSEKFLSQLANEKSALTTRVYEQDARLATTRFDAHGDVAVDQLGQVSTVPSGHGALLQLIPRVAEDFKEARGIFIRNIDNIGGNSASAIEASQLFLDAFSWTVGQMDELRLCITANTRQRGTMISNRILDFWGIPPKNPDDALITLFSDLFHATPDAIQNDLLALVMRPLVLMGQVPNTARDIGGTCVFTSVAGVPQKLCLEVPHASPSCRANFLENPAKATHFNPVFVASEIFSNDSLRAWNDHAFWLIAKKSWRGKDVYYQESILYEMLGSSQYANVIFVEMPRLVFNPHKTLKDTHRVARSRWSI